MSPNSIRNLLQDVTVSTKDTPGGALHPSIARFFVAAITISFIIVHTPVHFIHVWYDSVIQYIHSTGFISLATADHIIAQKVSIIQQYIVPVRTVSFLGVFIVIAFPLGRAVVLYFRNTVIRETMVSITPTVIVSFIFLSLLVFPFKLGLMAEGYAQVSIVPFGVVDQSNQLYQRILVPAIANFIQFQGPLLYHVFSLCITIVFLYAVVLFFEIRDSTLSNIELISIGTSAFIITQFQSPGYTEPMAYLLIALLFIIPSNTLMRMSIVVLALLAHEVSAVVLLVIAYFYFTHEEKWMTISIFILYVFFWLFSFGFDPARLLEVRAVGNGSALSWIAKHPLREFFGIVISFKLLWIPLLYVAYRMKYDRYVILGFIAAGILLTFGGVDTSRLAGYAFVALLLSYFLIKKHSLIPPKVLTSLLVVNILIPSIYISTNFGAVFFNGLYQLMYLGVLLR